MAAQRETVEIEGRRISLSNLDKVMYPESGTTKGEVIEYYRSVAGVMVPAVRDRPTTRKRWVHGVGTAEEPGEVFFQKNLDARSTPEWVQRVTLHHRHSTNTYPLVNDTPTLVWLAQIAALEIHVPQWRAVETDTMINPDRLVIDLDPGPGAGLPECVEVAQLVKSIFDDMGLVSVPVTSGSKGIHLYAKLDGSQEWEAVSAVARELAKSLEADHPDLVVADQKKTLREGRVLVDWSQNSGQKTTIAPYSLRGRVHPMVAAPRTWEEIASPALAHVRYNEMAARLEKFGDLFAPLHPPPLNPPTLPHAHDAGRSSRPRSRASAGARPSTRGGSRASAEDDDGGGHAPSSAAAAVPAGGTAQGDRLTVYRAKRDPTKTPEPVPPNAPTPGAGTAFVIHEHHARRLHWDLRLEHEGVLASFAIPKGIPGTSGRNNLAVHTEDHPLEYLTFSGSIPAGEYGAGEMSVWDTGTYEAEKWREDEIVVVLHGRPGGGLESIATGLAGAGEEVRLALIRTDSGGGKGTGGGGKENWLAHLMKDQTKGHWSRGAKGSGAHDAEIGAPDAEIGSPDAEIGAPDAEIGATRAGPAPEPMLAQQGTPGLVRGDEWGLEMKWDGIRAIVDARAEPLRLMSRKGIDQAATYPELAGLMELGPAVLDGEIVAFDSRGRPDFGLLQQRMNLGRPADVERARRDVPVQIVLFDLLEYEGRDLTRLPFRDRRAALELLAEGGLPANAQLSPMFHDDPEHVLAASAEHGLEGIVAKRLGARYEPGRRSGAWVKIKNERVQEVVVAGWREGNGSRSATLGSLLVGIPDDAGRLAYAGRVGSGFTEATLAEIAGRLRGLERKTSPMDGVPAADARDAHWVTPKFVAEVRYGEFTADGRLRHPVWRGWRPDKDPQDVALGP
ncbi:ATP-dependent DNA ligase [Sinomonas cyclohexanicum]|uniref:DNA ligase (ATP) n=1 Tax=Sinomonas cyclohexanicum TaxID=322009 RepID=A0ABN6FLI4_SINCY|nr:ATP-dependent DNA ligase [Corynebacterium cyclohexanicum]BCT77707.1 ATP-dependent DNA ligase [Corynebacterium cyclohexanicum]